MNISTKSLSWIRQHRILTVCIAFVLTFTILIAARTIFLAHQNLQENNQQPLYSAEELQSAIHLGEQYKFDTSKLTGLYKVSSSNEDTVIISTPYSNLAFASAEAARKYESLSSDLIQSYAKNAPLEITVFAYTKYDQLANNVSAVIKIDGQVIHPLTSDVGENVTPITGGGQLIYQSTNNFSFLDLASFKDKKFQFVFIKPDGEETYDIDMTKFK